MNIKNNPKFDWCITGRLICVAAAARKLKRKPRTVRWMIGEGRLPARKINRKSWGILSSDVERLRLRMEGECSRFNC